MASFVRLSLIGSCYTEKSHLRLGSHQQHNNHNHNHADVYIAYLLVGGMLKNIIIRAYDQHNHNYKKMIKHFLMIMFMISIIILVLCL